jgi:enoyl-CoA hydratase
MRRDRLSVYESLDLDLAGALAREHEHGAVAVHQEAAVGAARFSAGAGRHGAPTSPAGAEPVA